MTYRIYETNTLAEIARYNVMPDGGNANNARAAPGPVHVYVPAAGTYVWKVQAMVNLGTAHVSFINCKLVAYEL